MKTIDAILCNHFLTASLHAVWMAKPMISSEFGTVATIITDVVSYFV
jgi:hypothetical protein